MIKNTLIIILFLISVSSCSNNTKQAPKAVKGVLDLRNWDFQQDGIANLDGEWEFYWQEFLTSDGFDTVRLKHYVNVPSTWKGYKWDSNTILPFDGYVSYKLRILMNSNKFSSALKIQNCGTSYRLYLNDSLYGGNGKAGINKETSVPQYLSKIYRLAQNQDTIDLILHVSNFHYWKGGVWFSINLGDEADINKYRDLNLVMEYSAAGSFFIIFVYFFILYFYFQKDKVSLYWSIGCLIWVFRFASIGETYITQLFPDFSWELLIKFELISFFAASMLITLYFYGYLRKVFSRLILKIIVIYCSTLILISIFTKAVFFSNLNVLHQIIVILIWIYLIYVCFKAIKLGIESSKLIMFSIMFYFFSLINTFLHFNNVINTFDTSGYGVIVFTIIQSIIIAQRYSYAFKKIENFAVDLKKEVDNKTKDLKLEKEKTEKLLKETDELLKNSDRLLLNVLPEQIANRLKSGETPIADHFEEASVIFIDIADFTKMSAKSTPQKMVNMLNEIFSIFDKISAKYGLEKIKTIGDCYMAAAGIPVPMKDHAHAIAMMALDVMETMKGYSYSSDDFKSSYESYIINFRIGLDCGPIVAGVIGEQKFIYDLWGDMVNTASRMETNGIIGKIQCTERFKEKIEQIPLVPPLSKVESGAGGFYFEERGEIEVKGKGMMRTYFLEKIND